MLAMFEMLMFAPCPICHPFPCRQLVGRPESGSAPPSFARIRTLLLCIGISIELPEPERCRGTVFVIVAVAPLSFPPRWQMLHIVLINILINGIKLAHVIRIMLTTSRMFKIVVCINLLNAYGDLPKLLFVVPASFKLA